MKFWRRKKKEEVKLTQEEFLELIYKRLGWVLFWVVVFGIVILNNLPD